MKTTCVTAIVLFILSLTRSFGQHPLDAEAAEIPSANNVREAVEYLIHAEDVVPGDRALMYALSIGSLDEIQTQLSNCTEPRHIFRGMYILSYKYKQYEQQIDSAKKERIVQTLVTRAEQMPGDRALNYLKGINHPLVRSLALKCQASPEKIVRITAEQLLRSLDEAPSVATAAKTVGITTPTTNPQDTEKQPSTAPKIEPHTMPATAENPQPAWWFWSIGGGLSLVLVLVFIKKSSNQ